jgi:DNA-binding NtrC family response regulator
VLEALYHYDWPGNIRELQNVLRRYLAIQQLDFLDAPAEVPAAESFAAVGQGQSLNEVMARFERTVIEKCLEHHRWHRGKTAAALKIDRKTLFSKMKAYGLI